MVHITRLIKQHKSKKMVIYSTLHIGISTHSILKGAKHLNSTPNMTSFTHHQTGIQQWERNDNILTLEFEVNG